MWGRLEKNRAHDVKHQGYGAAMLEAFVGISSADLAGGDEQSESAVAMKRPPCMIKHALPEQTLD
jgi:hypothetical protein